MNATVARLYHDAAELPDYDEERPNPRERLHCATCGRFLSGMHIQVVWNADIKDEQMVGLCKPCKKFTVLD